MAAGDQYRSLAAECNARARREADAVIRAEWGSMAQAYCHLAEQAERNALVDIVYETPAPHVAPQSQAQQQPQSKLAPEE
jgi:hypothetical protein